ncbi:MAG: hypothetical protein ABW250_05785, partial [Pyrinomonadaceae bacterium]
MSRNFFRPLGVFALLATLLLAGLPGSRVSRASSDSVENGEESYIPNEINVKLLPAAGTDISFLTSPPYGLALIEQFGNRPIYSLRLTANSPAGLDSKALAAKVLA